MNFYSKKILLFLCIILIIIPFSQTSASQLYKSSREMDILRLYYKEEDLVITPTRHQKDILQVAENIAVITAEEIEMINAHTLTDVLNNIPGIKIEIKGGPVSASSAYIQGSDLFHVLVMIDGVAMNNLSDNAVDIGAIPIQNIERIEIIKGPASSSWGSSLGGIINIITKPPSDSEKITGTYSAFYGEKNSTDHRAEASAKAGNAGYYFYAGNLSSNGLTEGTPYDADNLYSKLCWNLGERGRLFFTLGYNEGSRDNFAGELYDPNYGLFFISEQDAFKYLFSTLNLEHSINDNAKFKFSFRYSSMDVDKELSMYHIETKMMIQDPIKTEESLYGGSIDLTWNYGINNILFGLDYDRGRLKSENVIGGKQYLEKWAVFSNDTIMIDKFSLTPGLRYDHTNTNDDHVSPSFGLTYMMTERNLFRGFIVKGFHIPPLSYTFSKVDSSREPNPDLKIEKILSMQAGVESTALKYLWLKTTLFYHKISDGIVIEETKGKKKAVNRKRKQKRQGIELEVKTVSVYNTSFFAGFSFIDAEKIPTHFTVPKYTFDIGINYNNNEYFGAYLKGHYIYWDYSEDYQFNQDHIFIWDINLMKHIHWDNKLDVKTFFTIHNIFNGSPYQSYNNLFEYPGRWIEAGLKFDF